MICLHLTMSRVPIVAIFVEVPRECQRSSACTPAASILSFPLSSEPCSDLLTRISLLHTICKAVPSYLDLLPDGQRFRGTQAIMKLTHNPLVSNPFIEDCKFLRSTVIFLLQTANR
jgi:hypothetical protein